MEKISFEHLRQLVYNAHRNISFSPEKRAETIITEYAAELNQDIATIEGAIESNTAAENTDVIVPNYCRRYESKLKTWLNSLSNTASAAITGPSNFPTERMRKRNAWADNHYLEFRSWRQRSIVAILRDLKQKTNDLEKAEASLASRQKVQRIMVEANKIIRKNGPETRSELAALGLTETQIDEIVNPKWSKHKGFRPNQIDKGNAEIARLKIRVAELREKKQKGEGGNISEVINGISLIQNFEIDRVQIIFPEKPSKEICGKVRSAGFIWAPSLGAWQRKLTPRALTEGRWFLEKL